MLHVSCGTCFVCQWGIRLGREAACRLYAPIARAGEELAGGLDHSNMGHSAHVTCKQYSPLQHYLTERVVPAPWLEHCMAATTVASSGRNLTCELGPESNMHALRVLPMFDRVAHLTGHGVELLRPGPWSWMRLRNSPIGSDSGSRPQQWRSARSRSPEQDSPPRHGCQQVSAADRGNEYRDSINSFIQLPYQTAGVGGSKAGQDSTQPEHQICLPYVSARSVSPVLVLQCWRS